MSVSQDEECKIEYPEASKPFLPLMGGIDAMMQEGDADSIRVLRIFDRIAPDDYSQTGLYEKLEAVLDMELGEIAYDDEGYPIEKD